jgi:hypothetical protein
MQYWLCKYEWVISSIVLLDKFSPTLMYLKVDTSICNLSTALTHFLHMYIPLWIKMIWYCIDIESILITIDNV